MASFVADLMLDSLVFLFLFHQGDSPWVSSAIGWNRTSNSMASVPPRSAITCCTAANSPGAVTQFDSCRAACKLKTAVLRESESVFDHFTPDQCEPARTNDDFARARES